MGVIQLITMPLFFASNALYPIELMPQSLQYVTWFNPLYYVVDSLRSLLITNDLSSVPLHIGILLFITILFVPCRYTGFKTTHGIKKYLLAKRTNNLYVVISSFSSRTMTITIRNAKEKDLQEIVEIFNQAVHTRNSTGYLDKVSVEERKQWFSEHCKKNYPILLAEQNNTIIGWISIDPYRKGRKAFKKTVEASLFIHKDHKRKGVAEPAVNHNDAHSKKIRVHDNICYRVRYKHWK